MPRLNTKTPNKEAVELEYNALRGEILKRIELRQQVLAITLTLAGVFLSVGLTENTVALIYPPLGAFLAIAWAQNDYRIRDLATYIRKNLEGPSTGLNYESYIQRLRGESTKLSAWRFVVISHNGIFLLTQLMAVGMAVATELAKATPPAPSPLQWALFIVDLISIVAVIIVAAGSGR